MSWSDPIADMLTRIRNGYGAKQATVAIPHSRIKAQILAILKREGYVEKVSVEAEGKRILRVALRYSVDGQPCVRGVQRTSKPGVRRYVVVDRIPKVLGGMGLAILNTSKGMLTDQEARQQNVGGEVICKVW
ncbi:MAG: 30S ribosomal protein S8 [Lentisphaerae bacterium RIFOXYC12_FULL_60_16]|nr:MAG: 30S ribosomal protein S8 [Lentisphaerae bacterium RIFOXYC12_FULL_60_16]OGV72567.1 MAG: 30S ribosomal protein S8 [Lentisphaerae bacterium RIFOXYA12_FULL_60_10]OGV77312.1 MAG: 30S ribosomal protein S8 [Lentisphaerae bacterium RIFOXYB12_FULL_60_10]